MSLSGNSRVAFMPRSCRPGFRGIELRVRCGAGASAISEVYRPGATAAASGRGPGRQRPAIDVPEPPPGEARGERVQADDREEADGVPGVEPEGGLENRVPRSADH